MSAVVTPKTAIVSNCVKVTITYLRVCVVFAYMSAAAEELKHLRLHVIDYDIARANDLLGEALIPIELFSEQQQQQQHVHNGDSSSGSVHVDVPLRATQGQFGSANMSCVSSLLQYLTRPQLHMRTANVAAAL